MSLTYGVAMPTARKKFVFDCTSNGDELRREKPLAPGEDGADMNSLKWKSPTISSQNTKLQNPKVAPRVVGKGKCKRQSFGGIAELFSAMQRIAPRYDQVIEVMVRPAQAEGERFVLVLGEDDVFDDLSSECDGDFDALGFERPSRKIDTDDLWGARPQTSATTSTTTTPHPPEIQPGSPERKVNGEKETEDNILFQEDIEIREDMQNLDLGKQQQHVVENAKVVNVLKVEESTSPIPSSPECPRGADEDNTLREEYNTAAEEEDGYDSPWLPDDGDEDFQIPTTFKIETMTIPLPVPGQTPPDILREERKSPPFKSKKRKSLSNSKDREVPIFLPREKRVTSLRSNIAGNGDSAPAKHLGYFPGWPEPVPRPNYVPFLEKNRVYSDPRYAKHPRTNGIKQTVPRSYSGYLTRNKPYGTFSMGPSIENNGITNNPAWPIKPPPTIVLDKRDVGVYLTRLPAGTNQKVLVSQIFGGQIHSMTIFTTSSERGDKAALVFFLTSESADRFVCAHQACPMVMLNRRIEVYRRIPDSVLALVPNPLAPIGRGETRVLVLTQLPSRLTVQKMSRWLNEITGVINMEGIDYTGGDKKAVLKFLKIETARETMAKLRIAVLQSVESEWKSIKIQYGADPCSMI